MTRLLERPTSVMTRHFFSGLFHLGFLADTGTLSFTRLIIGICTSFLSFGLLLLRVYFVKYANLSAAATPEPYRHAVVADHAFLIALPMWIVAFATVLAGHALFPDETDFRVLMALPVSRRIVFAAKLLALALFTGLFLAFAAVALLPLVTLMAASRWAEGVFVLRVGSFVLATLLASAFAALAVTAVHGMLLVIVRPRRALAWSAAVRSVLLFGLMLSLPWVVRLTSLTIDAFSNGSPWLYLVPPAWFVGAEQYLLGDHRAHVVRLAQVASAAVVLAGGVAAGSYSVLYRHFDRLMLRPSDPPSFSARNRRWIPCRRLRGEPVPPRLPEAGETLAKAGFESGCGSRQPWGAARARIRSRAFVAIRAFTLITLRRSALHQGVLVCLSAVGAGFVANSFLSSGVLAWREHDAALSRRMVESVIWAPFALMYVACRAVRASLLLPLEQRANWIFRMTERDAARADQLDASTRTARLLGVILPIALVAPFQWRVLGSGGVSVILAALLWGWLYVELLMKDWLRLPFTCSYIPGKQFVPRMIVVGLVSFLGFTVLGPVLAHVNMSAGPAAVVVDLLLLGGCVVLRHLRFRAARSMSLEFEDALPMEVSPLRLNTD